MTAWTCCRPESDLSSDWDQKFHRSAAQTSSHEAAGAVAVGAAAENFPAELDAVVGDSVLQDEGAAEEHQEAGDVGRIPPAAGDRIHSLEEVLLVQAVGLEDEHVVACVRAGDVDDADVLDAHRVGLDEQGIQGEDVHAVGLAAAVDAHSPAAPGLGVAEGDRADGVGGAELDFAAGSLRQARSHRNS